MTDDPRESRALTLGEELSTRMLQFRAALPLQIKPEKFARVVLTAIQNAPKLAQMDRASLWNACMRAAQDGLLPDGRDGALVPFKGKVVWMVMVGGLRKKVRNSEEIATWDVYAVHAKDVFDYELGDEPFIKHKPFIEGDPGPLIAAYSVAVLKSGEKTREVMTRAEIEYVRDIYAQTDNDGQFSPAWRKSFDEMAKKTVARRHSKVLPMSTDIEEIIRRDDEQIDDSEKRRRNPGPKPTLTEKLQALASVDVETGEIKDGQRLAPDEVLAHDTPDGAGPATQRRPKIARDPIQDRLQAEGDVAAAQGTRALDIWWDSLTSDDIAHITAVMDRTWREIAEKEDLNEN